MQYELLARLYDQLIAHHGTEIGVRHARKHLGWALDAAEECAPSPPNVLGKLRHAILTANDPIRVHGHLAEAFDSLASIRGGDV
jgi:hypothetical protein